MYLFMNRKPLKDNQHALSFSAHTVNKWVSSPLVKPWEQISCSATQKLHSFGRYSQIGVNWETASTCGGSHGLTVRERISLTSSLLRSAFLSPAKVEQIRPVRNSGPHLHSLKTLHMTRVRASTQVPCAALTCARYRYSDRRAIILFKQNM